MFDLRQDEIELVTEYLGHEMGALPTERLPFRRLFEKDAYTFSDKKHAILWGQDFFRTFSDVRHALRTMYKKKVRKTLKNDGIKSGV